MCVKDTGKTEQTRGMGREAVGGSGFRLTQAMGQQVRQR